MSKQIKVLSDMEISGQLSYSYNLDTFPANPAPRTIIVKEGMPYIYTELVSNSGYFSWMPIGSKRGSYLHTQGVASQTWTVNHNLNTNDYVYFVYDSNHTLMYVTVEAIDLNTAQINLTEAMTGTAVFYTAESAAQPLGSSGSSSGTLDGNVILANAAAYTDSAITSEVTARTSAITAAIASANAYTDTHAGTGGITLTELSTSEANANAYTDSAITSEVTSRTSAITTAITSEASTRASADTTNATAITALTTRVDALISNTDSVALNSLTEIVSAFQTADNDLNNAITTLATSTLADANAYTDTLVSTVGGGEKYYSFNGSLYNFTGTKPWVVPKSLAVNTVLLNLGTPSTSNVVTISITKNASVVATLTIPQASTYVEVPTSFTAVRGDQVIISITASGLNASNLQLVFVYN